MRSSTALGVTLLASVLGLSPPRIQQPAIAQMDEAVLRDYEGVYRFGPDAFLYLQLWDEFSGFARPKQLVAFDEGGDVRVLFPAAKDEFFAGPGAAISKSVESRITFQRGDGGRIASLTWQREGSAARTAARVEIERRENVRFSNGGLRLAGTLTRPSRDGRHPAIVLVHGSGPEDRDYILPFARFLVRHGIAVLGYDKRGVGASTGDWTSASFDDLAGDVVAAFEYLKTRPDIDSRRVGLLGVSQAGWIMPIAATRSRDLAFLISISGAGVTPAETTIDQAQNEMTAIGMKPDTVAEIVSIMRLQYAFARTGQGWDEYAAARQKLAGRIGPPPPSMPGTPDHPSWSMIRRTYFHDPAPVLRQLKVPVLAIFGELDNNIVAGKNRAAWDRALSAGGHTDYTLRILPKANHLQMEAKAGSNAEMPTLRRFVPDYFTTVLGWLAKRIELR